jgi:hypothetical protein
MSGKWLKILGAAAIAWIVIFTLGYYLLFNSGGTVPEEGYGEPLPLPPAITQTDPD